MPHNTMQLTVQPKSTHFYFNPPFLPFETPGTDTQAPVTGLFLLNWDLIALPIFSLRSLPAPQIETVRWGELKAKDAVQIWGHISTCATACSGGCQSLHTVAWGERQTLPWRLVSVWLLWNLLADLSLHPLKHTQHEFTYVKLIHSSTRFWLV